MRYSDRKKISESGTLGPLEFAVAPDAFRVSLVSVYENAARGNRAGAMFDQRVVAKCVQHFGRTLYGVNSSAYGIRRFILESTRPIDELLDLIEILLEEAVKPWTFQLEHGPGTWRADPEIEERLNAIFVRHRVGYAVAGGEVRRIGSPALDEALVGPALLALARPGWESADRSFRDALHHRRGGVAEREAAITDAHAALEAAMKAAGLKGDRLSALAKSFRNSGLVPSQLESVPEALDTLLKRSSAIRDPLSDAHGKAPGAEVVPAGIVDLAIHWTGAFIVFLAASVPD